LPEEIWQTADPAGGGPSTSPATYEAALAEFKRNLVAQAIQASDGNYTEAARRLGVHVSYVHRLVRNFDLRRDGKGAPPENERREY
jgi:DNA-binding NtrC family response regulator